MYADPLVQRRPVTFTPHRLNSDMLRFHGLFMAHTLSPKNRSPVLDFQTLTLIRHKFRDVFGCDATMSDEALARHYRVSGDGDLIMILR
jgi:hypothetical protein